MADLSPAERRQIQQLASTIGGLQRQVAVLSRASQIAHSTVPVPDGQGAVQDMLVPVAVGRGVQAGFDAKAVDEALTAAKAELEQAQAQLDSKLADLGVDLSDAVGRLDTAEGQISDAFGQITGLDGRVDTVVSAAATAQQTADQAIQDAESKSAAAEQAAKSYADAEAEAARLAAIAAASSDASDKAAAAEAAATAAAAADALAKAQAAQQAAESYAQQLNDSLADTLADFTDQTTTKLGDMQSQIDGAIESWYLEGEPTLSNAPAVDWTTDEVKSDHVGDLYYNKTDGKSYRFFRDGTSWVWAIITDSDITKALANAAAAKDTADAKRRVFVAQPVPPYDVGDLWSGGADGELRRCNVARASGSFVSGDWGLASKYTDDTAAKAAQDAAEAAQSTADNLPKILHGTTTPGTVSAPDGSVWWQHAPVPGDPGSLQGNVVAQWNRVADQWVPAPIDSEALANVDIGKLTAGGAAIAEAVIQQLITQTASVQRADIANLFASEASIDEAVINRLWADVFVARIAYAQKVIAGEAIIDGTLTARQLAAEVMNGQIIRGAYIEAPIIASSPNLGTGANVLEDPQFESTLDTAWVASGHTGDTGIRARNHRIVWDQSWTLDTSNGSTEKRNTGDVTVTTEVLPVTRTAGSVLLSHREFLDTTTATTTDPYTFVDQSGFFSNQASGAGDPSLASATVLPVTASSVKTTYLTNNATVSLIADETWSVSLGHSGVQVTSVDFVRRAAIQLVDASSGALIWERELAPVELQNASPINVAFASPVTAEAKFRIMAEYSAAGGGVRHQIDSGYLRAYANGTLLTDGSVIEDASGYNVDPATDPNEWNPTRASLNIDFINASAAYAGAEGVENRVRANASWTVTSAVLSQVNPEKGFRLDVENGAQFFNNSGALTGRLDGEDNFLSGRLATSDSGSRAEMAGQELTFFDAASAFRGAVRFKEAESAVEVAAVDRLDLTSGNGVFVNGRQIGAEEERIALDPAQGYVADAVAPPYVSLIDGWVKLGGVVKPSSGSFPTNATFFPYQPLPQRFWPSQPERITIVGSNARTFGIGIVYDDGRIEFRTAPDSTGYLSFTGDVFRPA